MQFVYSSRFDKDFQRVTKKNLTLANKIIKTIKQFEKNPAHPSLRLHKLAGSNNYSISVNMNVRMIIHLDSEKTYLLRVGSHEEVY